MGNTKKLVLGGLLACIAVLFQIIPVIFSEVFVLLTILSALPIYIIARISPKIGAAVYAVAAILISYISLHEGLFFLCTNGIVGLSLGICSFYTDKKVVTITISSVILTTALGIINYLIGIPVFGMNIPGTIINQLAIILTFSILYNIFYYYMVVFVFKALNKYYTLE